MCKNKKMTSVKTTEFVCHLTATIATDYEIKFLFLFFGKNSKKIQKKFKKCLVFLIFTEKYATW